MKLSLESTMTGVQTSHLFRSSRAAFRPERLNVTRRSTAFGSTPERTMASRKIKGADFSQNKSAERKPPHGEPG